MDVEGDFEQGTPYHAGSPAETTANADCISVEDCWDWYDTHFADDPTANPSGKPAFDDCDHTGPYDSGNPMQVWKTFTRGYHFSLYDNIFSDPSDPNDESEEWERIRYNIGATARYANEVVANLAAMTPQDNLSSTTFCLADPGNEYIIYSPDAADIDVTVHGLSSGQQYYYEWYDTNTNIVVSSGNVTPSSSSKAFKPQDYYAGGNAVLYLKKTGGSTDTTVTFEDGGLTDGQRLTTYKGINWNSQVATWLDHDCFGGTRVMYTDPNATASIVLPADTYIKQLKISNAWTSSYTQVTITQGSNSRTFDINSGLSNYSTGWTGTGGSSTVTITNPSGSCIAYDDIVYGSSGGGPTPTPTPTQPDAWNAYQLFQPGIYGQ